MAGITKFYPQPREGTGLNRRFERAQEEDFTAHDDFYATAEFIYLPIVNEILRLMGLSHDAMIPGGRLTLTSGTAVTTADVTAATNIYYTPYNSQMITLWDTTAKTWYAYPFAEITLALGTITTLRPYDVFAYVNTGTITNATSATPIEITSTSHGMSTGTLVLISGVKGNTAANGFRKITSTGANTFTITDLDGTSIAFNAAYESGGTFYQVKTELLAWTSDTARATALTTQNGIYVKTGALDRRYLGTFRTTSTTTTEDSNAKRFVWNMYNRERRKLRVTDATNSWNYTTATLRQANNSTANQVEVVIGVAGQTVDLLASALSLNASVCNRFTGIGVNSTTVNSADCIGIAGLDSGAQCQGTAKMKHYPAVGYSYYAWLEASSAVGTSTWTGDNGDATLFLSGMVGDLWA